MIKLLVILALVLALAGMGYIRLAPSDPARWHEDPRLVQRPRTPNYHLVRMVDGDALPQVFDEAPRPLAERIDAVARADGAVLLAGSVSAGHMTYLTRTPIMGYPDYTSIRVEPAGEGAMVLAFARARFGHSDMGNNRARVERWLAALSG